MTNAGPTSPGSGLDVTWRVTTDWVVVAVFGEVDMATAPQFDVVLREAAEHATPTVPLLVEMRSTTFLGSAGLRAIVTWHQRCAEQGITLSIGAPSPVVRRLLRITGLNSVLTVVPQVPAWSALGG